MPDDQTVRINMSWILKASIEHAAVLRSMTASTFMKMAIVERLEKMNEMGGCDPNKCNGAKCKKICNGKGGFEDPNNLNQFNNEEDG